MHPSSALRRLGTIYRSVWRIQGTKQGFGGSSSLDKNVRGNRQAGQDSGAYDTGVTWTWQGTSSRKLFNDHGYFQDHIMRPTRARGSNEGQAKQPGTCVQSRDQQTKPQGRDLSKGLFFSVKFHPKMRLRGHWLNDRDRSSNMVNKSKQGDLDWGTQARKTRSQKERQFGETWTGSWLHCRLQYPFSYREVKGQSRGHCQRGSKEPS